MPGCPRRRLYCEMPGGQGPGRQAGGRKDAEYVGFLFSRLRTWLLLAIALPLARLLVHRLAVAADRRDPSARTARLPNQADSAVATVPGRVSRSARR
jgi:hypothetical protein